MTGKPSLLHLSLSQCPFVHYRAFQTGNGFRYWSGDISLTLKSIPPGARRRLRITAILTSYASYDLSECSLTRLPTPADSFLPMVLSTSKPSSSVRTVLRKSNTLTDSSRN